MIWIRDNYGRRFPTYADKTVPARPFKPPSAALLNFRREERILQEQSILKKLTPK